MTQHQTKVCQFSDCENFSKWKYLQEDWGNRCDHELFWDMCVLFSYASDKHEMMKKGKENNNIREQRLRGKRWESQKTLQNVEGSFLRKDKFLSQRSMDFNPGI